MHKEGPSDLTARESLANPFQLASLIDRLAPRRSAQVRVTVRRPDDHLVLDLLFDNLRVYRGQGRGAQLVRDDAGRRGVLIVEFPPQSFGEQAFLQPSKQDGDLSKELPPRAGFDPQNPGPTVQKNKPPPSPSAPLPALPTARVRMSGPSRLAFTMPGDVAALPFTLASVLQAMREWPMRLDVNARPDVPTLLALPDRAFEVLRDALSANVSDPARVDVNLALAGGTRRIAELAAGGLTRSGAHDVSGVMWEAIRQESGALFEHHPELRTGDLRTATLAAFALGSAATLSRMAESSHIARDDALVSEQLPYLSLLTGIPHEPSPTSTALELPYRLFLSPIGEARWHHHLLPIDRHGRTELWHTRLGSSAVTTGAGGVTQIRILWSPDMDNHGNVGRPFRMSLDAQDREFLVRLMADWTQRRADPRFSYQPRPGLARRLHLSSLGALLDAGGEWDPRPEGVDLEQWRHLATLGRDHYVRVVYSGFLVPFGHAASLVKVTERKFESLGGNGDERIAVLRQRFFIIVRERRRNYESMKHLHQYGGRNCPFTEVEVLTQVTPDLTDPKQEIFGVAGTTPVTARMAFWPQLPGTKNESLDFRFEIAATDVSGRRVTFSLPMLFVSEVLNAKRSPAVRVVYTTAGADRRTAELGGASISYSRFPGANPDDSRLSTTRLTFSTNGAFPYDPATPGVDVAFPLAANFFPEVARTAVNVPALQKLLGRDDAFEMTYPEVDNAAGFDNAGGIFLWAAKALKLSFGGGSGKAQTDALGGLASPELDIIGLSSLTGPVSGDPALPVATALANVADNKFEPADFFRGAKLLGGIDLASIVQAAAGLGLGGAPKFHSTEGANDVVTTFDWETDVKPERVAKPLFIPNADGISGSRLEMHGRIVTPLGNPSAATREATAGVRNFKLNLFGFIILWFEQLTFQMKPGQKPDVTVQLREGDAAVEFGGPLEFVNELRKYIPSNGFSDSPALSITPSGISAGFSLGLPTLSVGIFSLSNVSLGAGFSLPLDNRPISVRFSFAERQRPFSLIVSGLGGGGFFALAIGANGVQEIEAALEFGAAIAINLGVASGGVEIKAGVYFHWKDDGMTSAVVLAGYVRIHGELTVLCLVSASLTFNLQLGYQKVANESLVFGEAELIVEIEVLFLSFDVAVRCRREFAGGVADPKFIDLIPSASVWDEYCAAFAPEPV
jgi:hypothetical protein